MLHTFDSLHSPAPELQSLRRNHGGDTSGVKNLHQSGVSSSSACLVKGFGLYSLQQQFSYQALGLELEEEDNKNSKTSEFPVWLSHKN
ncbi:unnamed protein product [Citrullus colocynthis]|uniref:Uncharacterized protein n=1 Tax=Citrullus colocynthis TaxID=252529 RepID=A0ABP0YPF0_9ROSI